MFDPIFYLQISGISVGKLTKVRLEHDNTGTNPDWKVDYVSMMDRAPTSSGNPGKPGKSQKSSMHGKIIEFENPDKSWKIVEFS